jgi:acetyltransferase-like isoleucine patch superfamily enzyme
MSIKKTIKRLFVRPKPFSMNQNKKYARYEIGDWTHASGKLRIRFRHAGGVVTKLKIGRFCLLADGVTILLGGEHRVDWVTMYPVHILFGKKNIAGYPRSKGDIIIGNDVWIGTDALILSGVKIGDGAVIAARSVVTKDIAPYSIVAGNPAQVIRFRFKKSIIADLQKIAWWNWPLSKIEEACPLLLSSDIEAFIAKYKK